MKNIKLLLFVLLCSISFGYGQEIISYSSLANSACSGIIANDPNVSGVGICRSSGIIAAAGGTYNSRNWTTNPSIDLNDYLEWTITPNAGYVLNLEDLNFRYDRSNTGPTMLDLQVNSGTGFVSVYTDSAVDPFGENNTINLSTYANITETITFRLYAFNAGNASAGTFDIEEHAKFNKGIIINGAVSLMCPSTTTWETVAAVTAWDNGAPNSTTTAILDANYNTLTDGDITACSLTVNTGATLSIDKNSYAEIENNVINSGTVNIGDEGSFVQVNDAATYTNTGSGITQVNKLTAPISAWYEYTYWSSPVQGEQIGDAFVQTNPNRRFYYNAANFRDSGFETNNDNVLVFNTTSAGVDDVDDNGNDWQYAMSGDIMQPGIGYACTLSPAYFNTLPPMATSGEFAHSFIGPLNNGIFSIPIYRNDVETNDFNNNFIGNPYPSAIDFDLFMAENSVALNASGTLDGAVYLWSQDTPPTNTTNGNSAINFNNSDYAMINDMGQVAGGDNNNDGMITAADEPNRFIPSGQGFFVNYDNAGAVVSTFTNAAESNDLISEGAVTFTNAMRVTGNNAQFFKSSTMPIDDNKLWLLLSSDNGVGSQILVGYKDGATNADDGGRFDARRNASTGMAAFLYSTIENSPKNYAIQGKAPASLTLAEVIPLGIYTTINVATIYTLSISHLQGDFFNNNTIYLKDNLLNQTHNLSNNDYAFTSEVGDFRERFEIVFVNNTLGTEGFETHSNNLSIVELQNNAIKFSYNGDLTIKSVKIIDVLGRELYYFRGSESTEIFNLSNLSNAAYIARVELSNGNIISKKAIKK